MSRCFPFPPPGYVRNGVPGEALIESIKIQKGRDKAKTDRSNEKKREKKEKRKDKKSKKEKLTKIDDLSISRVNKSLQGDKFKEDPYLRKEKEDEAEQLEKSGLTEEHEQPVSSQTPCYLSDSTRSSNKRKRHSSPSSCSQSHGNILRIRLPSQKPRETDVSSSKEQLCSTSGRVYSVAQQKVPDREQCFNLVMNDTGIKKVTPCSTSGRVYPVAQQKVPDQEQCFNLVMNDTGIKKVTPSEELLPSTSGKDKKHSQAESAIGIKPHKDEKRLEKLYRLFDDFAPLALCSEQNDCDDQWLFETKRTDGNSSKRCRTDNNVLSSGSVPLWPQAHHLPEADIYVLPYTVPF